MSVVVRMELPQNCCHCPMIAYADKIKWVDNGRETEGAYICLFTKDLIDNTKRADNCPIICFIPEGHGRLVDADALYKKRYIVEPCDILASITVVDACYISGAETIVPAERSK